MVIIEKLKKIRDEKGVFVTVLTDLSKAFDYIPHQLLIAKLSAYCFDMKSIAFFPRTSKNENRKQTWAHLQQCLNLLVSLKVLFSGLFNFYFLLLPILSIWIIIQILQAMLITPLPIFVDRTLTVLLKC